MRVPWRQKFRIHFECNGFRFYFRILIGVVIIYAARQWEYIPLYETRHTELAIGWIPLNVEAGASVPCWKPYSRMYPEVKIHWGLKG